MLENLFGKQFDLFMLLLSIVLSVLLPWLVSFIKNEGFNKVIDVICTIVRKYISVVMLISMFVLLILGVIYRYILDNPLMFTEELSVYLYVWLSILASACVIYDNSAVKMDFIYGMFKPKTKKIANIIYNYISLSVPLFLIYYGFRLSNKIIDMGLRFDSINVSLSVFYLSMPIGFIFISIFLIKRIADVDRARRQERLDKKLGVVPLIAGDNLENAENPTDEYVREAELEFKEQTGEDIEKITVRDETHGEEKK